MTSTNGEGASSGKNNGKHGATRMQKIHKAKNNGIREEV